MWYLKELQKGVRAFNLFPQEVSVQKEYGKDQWEPA